MSAESQQLLKALKEIGESLKEQNRILRTFNQNYVAAHRNESAEASTALVDPVIVPPLESDVVQPLESNVFYGWNAATEAQLAGKLNPGDIKHEQDESLWVWTGDTWERIEAVSLIQ